MVFSKPWDLSYNGRSLQVYSAEVDYTSVRHTFTGLEVLRERKKDNKWITRTFLTSSISGESEIKMPALMLMANSKDFSLIHDVIRELYLKHLEVSFALKPLDKRES